MVSSNHLSFSAATDVGQRRSRNEDNYLVDREMGLFVVADGMGGHAAGEIASAIAVRTVHEILAEKAGLFATPATDGAVSGRQVLNLLDYAVQLASQRIHAEARRDRRKRGMGTTLSLLLIVGAHGYVAHVGDSRIYLVRGDATRQVTEDHTVSNELLRSGMATPEQLKKIPGRNAVTRAVGVYRHVEVDTLTLEVLPSDRFLIASDGLYGYFRGDPNTAVGSLLRNEDTRVGVAGLIDFANAGGGRDNITAVLVCLGGNSISDSVRARRLELKGEVLSAMPLFSRLNEREMLRVMQVATVREFRRGEVVTREGEDGDEMFVVLEGRLRVHTDHAVLSECTTGDHFGEMALIRTRPRSATVTAVDPSELVVLSRADFFEIIRVEPQIAVKLLWQFLGVLGDRLEKTSRDLDGARRAAAAGWDDEPSLDPFTSPVRVDRLMGAPDGTGWGEAAGVDTPVTPKQPVVPTHAQSKKSVLLDAQLIDDPPTFDSVEESMAEEPEPETSPRPPATIDYFSRDVADWVEVANPSPPDPPPLEPTDPGGALKTVPWDRKRRRRKRRSASSTGETSVLGSLSDEGGPVHASERPPPLPPRADTAPSSHTQPSVTGFSGPPPESAAKDMKTRVAKSSPAAPRRRSAAAYRDATAPLDEPTPDVVSAPSPRKRAARVRRSAGTGARKTAPDDRENFRPTRVTIKLNEEQRHLLQAEMKDMATVGSVGIEPERDPKRSGVRSGVKGASRSRGSKDSN